MCKYCGATQIEEADGRVICSYCGSPQPDIEAISSKNVDNKLHKIISESIKQERNYSNMFKGCISISSI